MDYCSPCLRFEKRRCRVIRLKSPQELVISFLIAYVFVTESFGDPFSEVPWNQVCRICERGYGALIDFHPIFMCNFISFLS